ncbi:MAG: hypothetical protein WB502_01185, partial [Thermoactinomyces sp.]
YSSLQFPVARFRLSWLHVPQYQLFDDSFIILTKNNQPSQLESGTSYKQHALCHADNFAVAQICQICSLKTNLPLFQM